MPTATRRRVASDLPPAVEGIPVSPDESPFSGNGGGTPRVTAEDIKDAAPDLPKSKADTELILASLLKTYTSIGLVLSMLPSAAADGFIIVSNAEELTESWRQLLDNDPKLRRIMKNAIKGTGWGAVISAHLMVAVPIVKNHSVSMEHLFRRREDVNDNG